jgi:hypothetical protein
VTATSRGNATVALDRPYRQFALLGRVQRHHDHRQVAVGGADDELTQRHRAEAGDVDHVALELGQARSLETREVEQGQAEPMRVVRLDFLAKRVAAAYALELLALQVGQRAFVDEIADDGRAGDPTRRRSGSPRFAG